MKTLITKLCEINIEAFPEEIRSKIIEFRNYIKGLDERDVHGEVEKCEQWYNIFFANKKRRRVNIESLENHINNELSDEKACNLDVEKLFCELLLTVHKTGFAEKFVLEMQQYREEKVNKEKRRNNTSSQKTPLPYRTIDNNTKELQEKIRERNVLEGYDGKTFMTMAQLIKSKLFISDFNIDEKRVGLKKYTKEIIKKMSKNEIRCLAIVSGLGRGKTLLTNLLVENICNGNAAKQAIIYLSSQKNMQTQDGNKIWKQFLEKNLGKDRQYWVIIDGLDEITSKKKNAVNLSKLNSAARFYNAKIIIGCREPYYNQIYLEERKILFSDKIFLYDSQQECMADEEYKEMKVGVPKKIMDKMMRIPLYKVWISVALKTWKRVWDEGNSSMQVFKSEYTFMEFLFKNTLLRERRNYNLSEEKAKDYRRILQRIALMRNKFSGNISAECLFDKAMELEAENLKSSFVQEFVYIKANDYEFQESVIGDFRMPEFGKYFYISGLCSALKEESQIIEWLDGYTFNVGKTAFLQGWREMPEDHKKRAKELLQKLEAESEEGSQLKVNIKSVLDFFE